MKKLLLLTLLLSAILTNIQAQFPNSGWFSKTVMPSAKWAHGFSSDLTNLFVIAGADGNQNFTLDVQKFSTVTNTWATQSGFPNNRYQVQATHYNGKVYVIGGYIGGFTPTNAVNIFDIATNTWSTGAVMPTAVGDYACVLNGDRIYVICGYNGFDRNLVQVYNITSNSWSAATAFPGTAVAGCRAGIVKNTIVFAGGYNQNLGSQSQAYKGVIDAVNPLQITWTPIANYPAGTINRHAAGSIEGPLASRVYFTAGDPNGLATTGLTSTYAYNILTNQWETGPNKPTGVNNIMAMAPLIVNDTLFFACDGGYTGATFSTSNEWLKIGRAYAAVVSIAGADTVCTGQISTLSVPNQGPMQWMSSTDNINFSFMPGETNNTYTTPPATQPMYYKVITYAHLDSFVSSSVEVIPYDSVLITSQPQSLSLCAGFPATFSVGNTGPNVTYQWYENNFPIANSGIYSGANTATLNISDVTGLDGNTYKVILTNPCNVVTSNTVTLTETASNIWIGVISTAWSNVGNWSCGVPTITTDATIPAGAPNMPLVDIPDAICHSITIDAGASLAFTGTGNALEIKTYIDHDGVFDPSLGRIILSGTVTQWVPAVTYQHLDVRGGSTKLLEGDVTVTENLNLSVGDIMLEENNLILSSPGSITSASDMSYIVTNDSGQVVAQSLGTGGNTSSVLLPVGRDGLGYTPISLQNTGALDTFNVRVKFHVYENGYGSGHNPPKVFSPVVDRTWLVTENTAGGSNVTMQLQWNDSNQINNFTTSHVYIAHYTGSQWVSLNGNPNTAPAAGGSNPFTASASNIQSFSPFTVSSSGGAPLALRSVNSAVFNLDAFPNPAMSVITLSVAGTVTGTAMVVVTDVMGKVVKTPVEMVNNKVEINIADVAPGMYFIKYTDDAHQELIKINKQ